MTSLSPLDNLHIATSCRANWERMDWEDEEGRVRFCRTCEKNVYNISLMSRTEALDLIRAKEGQVCLRLAKRNDGTLITNDCPVGQSKRQTKRRFIAFVSALLAALIPSPVSATLKGASAMTLRAVPIISTFENTPAGEKFFAWLEGNSQIQTLPPPVLMGKPAMPSMPVTAPLPNPPSLNP